jgi:hypothetical protein
MTIMLAGVFILTALSVGRDLLLSRDKVEMTEKK